MVCYGSQRALNKYRLVWGSATKIIWGPQSLRVAAFYPNRNTKAVRCFSEILLVLGYPGWWRCIWALGLLCKRMLVLPFTPHHPNNIYKVKLWKNPHKPEAVVLILKIKSCIAEYIHLHIFFDNDSHCYRDQPVILAITDKWGTWAFSLEQIPSIAFPGKVKEWCCEYNL